MKTILLKIVNDLEKTAAGLAVVAGQLERVAPMSAATTRDALSLAAQASQRFYDDLRKDIQQLP